MKAATAAQITVNGRTIDYRVVFSKAAKRMRIRVGLAGVEVIRPKDREAGDVRGFLEANGSWLLGQLRRIERFQSIRKPRSTGGGTLLFRGEPIAVRVEIHPQRAGANHIIHEGSTLVVMQSSRSTTPPHKSLENWLRKRAREELNSQLELVTKKLRRKPARVFIMGQRTKWGNCSSLQNISFNWRLILAPEFVLRYLVTHEAVHLAVPDHSHKFWLTVQSLCPDTEKARRWLSANGHRLQIDLMTVCKVS